MSSLRTLNKLPSTRAFSAAEKWIACQQALLFGRAQIGELARGLKNGRLEVLELVALFLLKTETCDAKNP